MVIYLCKQLQPDQVLSDITQGTLLCLAQQLGHDFSNDLTFKLDWLKDGLLALRVHDPSIASYCPEVLQQLSDNMNAILPEFRDSRWLLVNHILKSLLGNF